MTSPGYLTAVKNLTIGRQASCRHKSVPAAELPAHVVGMVPKYLGRVFWTWRAWSENCELPLYLARVLTLDSSEGKFPNQFSHRAAAFPPRASPCTSPVRTRHRHVSSLPLHILKLIPPPPSSLSLVNIRSAAALPFLFPSSLVDLKRDADRDDEGEPSLWSQAAIIATALRAANLEEFVAGIHIKCITHVFVQEDCYV